MLISISCPPDTISKLTQKHQQISRDRWSMSRSCREEENWTSDWFMNTEPTQLNHSQWINSTHFTCLSSSALYTITLYRLIQSDTQSFLKYLLHTDKFNIHFNGMRWLDAFNWIILSESTQHTSPVWVHLLFTLSLYID